MNQHLPWKEEGRGNYEAIHKGETVQHEKEVGICAERLLLDHRKDSTLKTSSVSLGLTVLSVCICSLLSSHCKNAKSVLGAKGLHFKAYEIDQEKDGAEVQAYLLQKTGQRVSLLL